MVHNGAVDGLRDRGETVCCAAVGAAGPAVSAGMIVGQDQAAAAICNGFRHDLPHQYGSAKLVAWVLTWLSVPIALFIGSVGAVSVFKAVYIDRRELKCACVGGSSNVPLGFVSLTENLMMIAMELWMAAGISSLVHGF